MKNNKTQEKILDVAAKILINRGYSETSMSMIAEEVGIKKASLYYYYKNKADLLSHLFISNFNDFEKDITKILAEETKDIKKLENIIIRIIEIKKNHPQIQYIGALSKDTAANKEFRNLLKDYRKDFFDLIDNAITQLDSYKNNEEFILLTKTMVMGILFTSFVKDTKEAERVTDIFIKFIRNKKDLGLCD